MVVVVKVKVKGMNVRWAVGGGGVRRSKDTTVPSVGKSILPDFPPLHRGDFPLVLGRCGSVSTTDNARSEVMSRRGAIVGINPSQLADFVQYLFQRRFRRPRLDDAIAGIFGDNQCAGSL